MLLYGTYDEDYDTRGRLRSLTDKELNKRPGKKPVVYVLIVYTDTFFSGGVARRSPHMIHQVSGMLVGAQLGPGWGLVRSQRMGKSPTQNLNPPFKIFVQECHQVHKATVDSVAKTIMYK